MKNHQIIFTKIKKLLLNQFGKDIVMHEEGAHLEISETGIWISMDEDDLTIGYGMNHRHYHHEYDDITEAIEEFFNLLTGKTRITTYYKGEYQYKNKVEVENSIGEYNKLSTSMTWLFPYWKKTNEKIEIIENLLSYNEIEREIIEIKDCVE